MQQQTTGWDPATSVSEQASGVYFAEGPASNWTVVRDGTGYILIDSGYPDDRRHVLASLHYLGLEPADALALVVTHGHVDHTGCAAFFSESYGTPVLCAPGELAHVQGKEKHQVTLGQVLSRAWRPRVFRWMVHAVRAGALAARPATRAEAWDAATLRALPGRPVALSLPGHTPGNAAILLPEAGAIVVGDSLVSGHTISRTSGPQMLPAIYHSDPGAAFAALRNLAGVDASVVLPGHGPALRIPLAEAVGRVVSPSRTRSRASRRTRQDGPGAQARTFRSVPGPWSKHRNK